MQPMAKKEIIPEVIRGAEKHGGALTGRMAPALVREGDSIDNFWKDCDREAVSSYMADDPRFAKLLKLMADPTKSRSRFSWLCQSAGIGLKDVCDLYMDRQRRSGMMRLAGRLPEVMADVGEDALSHKSVCRACEGGKLEDGSECGDCRGTGIRRTPGDAQARDLLFETFKFTNQKGPLIAMQQNFNNEPSSERLEDLFKLTSTITRERE